LRTAFCSYYFCECLCFVSVGKPGTDPNSAAWAAYYAHYYQQQAQPPPAAPPGGPATTQTNGQGSCSIKQINFSLQGVWMPYYFYCCPHMLGKFIEGSWFSWKNYCLQHSTLLFLISVVNKGNVFVL